MLVLVAETLLRICRAFCLAAIAAGAVINFTAAATAAFTVTTATIITII